MRHYFFSSLLLIAMHAFAYPPLPTPSNEAEALFVRRILEFWRDQEFSLAETQIKKFLEEHPQSAYKEHFWSLLGDIALHKKSYADALTCYEKIEQAIFKNEVRLKKWQALYALGAYAQLYQEVSAHAVQGNLEEDDRFFYAEAAFRQALALKSNPEKREEAQLLLEAAQPVYDSLLTSSHFSSYAKIGLAEISRLFNDYEKAAAFYLDLAAHDENEEILFHAATLLLQCNKEEAGKIFNKVAHGSSSQASDAAYQWLLLLAENKDWETIGRERDLLVARIAESRLPICYFYLGLISFDQKNHAQVLEDLQKCLRRSLPPQHEKKALFTLLVSAKELEKWEFCETFFDELVTRFPEVKAEAFSALAAAYQQGKDYSRALKLYEHLINEFPETEVVEKAAFERVRVIALQKKYEKAHEAALAFLTSAISSPRQQEMLGLAIEISLRQAAEKEELYAQVAADVEKGLAADIFQEEAKREYELLLAKAYLKMGRTDAAIQVLTSLEPSDPLLLTYCYLKQGTAPEKVVCFGEQALRQYPEEKRLHLHLFNTYLELAKEGVEKACAKQAAEHLFAVIDLLPVSLENRLWLAHYYAKEDPLKAIPLLQTILESKAQIKRFDEEALVLAGLFMSQKRLGEAEELLESVSRLQQKTEAEAKLKLAQISIMKGEHVKAASLLQSIEHTAQLNVAYTARLHLARLEFSSDTEKNLKKLHNLAVRKSLASEPVHLEAALDYAELKASCYSPEEQPARHLELLTEMKECFTQQEDIWSKDYHASRELHPDKDLIYQAYMRLLDARIYMLQAKMAQDPLEKKTKINAARALFSTLRHGKYAVSNYIKERAITAYEN